jgi:hypothetical protein
MGIAVLSSQSSICSKLTGKAIYYILYTVDYSHQGYLLCPFPANNLKKTKNKTYSENIWILKIQ